MNARTLATATLFTTFAGVLTAAPADTALLSMVMPDAKVLVGVNVDSAKASPFGKYVLNQMQTNNSDLQQLIAMTGFDPTRDVDEVLVATPSTANGTKSGLVLARGTFDPAMAKLAQTKGAATEIYNGVTIVEAPDKEAGIAFLSTSRVAAGDIASVKAAIDRNGSSVSLPSTVVAQVNQWSAQDAWMLTTVPLAALAPTNAGKGEGAGAGAGSGSGAGNGMPNLMAGVMQHVQQIAGGVKFGTSVVGTATIQSDTAEDATQIANTLQFFVNLMQMQAQKNPQMANLAQAFQVNAQGNSVNVSVTLPEAQFQQFFQHAAGDGPHVGERK